MELARLSGWHTAKDAEYKQSAAAWHRFRDAYNKRRRKHEEVKDHVGKELNTQFNKCAVIFLPLSPTSLALSTSYFTIPRSISLACVQCPVSHCSSTTVLSSCMNG